MKRIILSALEIVVLVMIVDIVAIVITGGFEFELFFLHVSSRRMGYPVCYLTLTLMSWSIVRFDLFRIAQRRFSKNIIANVSLVFAGLAAGVLIFEVVLRPFHLVFDAATVTHNDFADPQSKKGYQKDAELAYIPLIGREFDYSIHGTKHNEYPLEKRLGWNRVLFLGDSIIACGFTQEGLKKLTAGRKIEYWNGGVAGYSTDQEIRYFQRYCRKINPDTVILGFCLNDFDGSPVILKESDGKNIVAAPYLGREELNPWLFRNSVVYRGLMSVKLALTGRDGLVSDMKQNMRSLQSMSRQDNFHLSVIIYPWLDHYAQWPERYKQQANDINAILTEVGIPYYDLRPVLEEVLAEDDVKLTWQAVVDHIHPSLAFSERIAEHLLARDIFHSNKQSSSL